MKGCRRMSPWLEGSTKAGTSDAELLTKHSRVPSQPQIPVVPLLRNIVLWGLFPSPSSIGYLVHSTLPSKHLESSLFSSLFTAAAFTDILFPGWTIIVNFSLSCLSHFSSLVHWIHDSKIGKFIMKVPLAYRLKSKFIKMEKNLKTKNSSGSGTKLIFSPLCISSYRPQHSSNKPSLSCTTIYVNPLFHLSKLWFSFPPRELLSFKNQLLNHTLYQHNQSLSLVLQNNFPHTMLLHSSNCAVTYIYMFTCLLAYEYLSCRNLIFFVFPEPWKYL